MVKVVLMENFPNGSNIYIYIYIFISIYTRTRKGSESHIRAIGGRMEEMREES